MSANGFRYEENPRTFSEVRVLMNEHGSGFVIEIDYESASGMAKTMKMPASVAAHLSRAILQGLDHVPMKPKV